MKLIKNLSCGLIILLLFTIIISGYFIFDYYVNSAQENKSAISYYKDQDEIIIKVNSGETLSNVINQLYEKKLITNPLYFQIFSKINNFSKIQAGFYKIKPGSDFKDIVNALETPFEIEIKISFPEGLRIDEIADKISTQINAQVQNHSLIKFNKENFLSIALNPNGKINHPLINNIPTGKSLEGFLFPDTYLFPEDINTEDMIIKFLDNFNSKLETAKGNFKGIEDLSLSDYEIITLASIVEKEGDGGIKNNSLIADVFYKRLRGLNGPKKLESDVIILYQLKDWKATIYQTDLDNESYEYNSHVNEGLPPTPICNMGLNSLIAAFHPTPNDYLFFLADENGKIYYAKNYDEHLTNISKYLNN